MHPAPGLYPLSATQANPNSDPKGAWCVLARGQSTPAGAAWDYCLPGCSSSSGGSGGGSGSGSGSSTDPKPLGCARTTGLPTGCQCLPSYTITFQGYGTTRAGTFCTQFAESGSGMCVTNNDCTAAKNRGKAFSCACG